MPRLRLLASVACFCCVFVNAAADSRIYLQRDWYVVEIVAFERIDAPPSPEHLIHGSDYRTFSADLRSISPSQLEQLKLEEVVQSHSNTDSPPTFDGSTNNQVQSAKSTTYSDGCWLHHWTLSVADLDQPRTGRRESAAEQLENSEPRGLFDDQSVFSDDPPQNTRNPLLPDWLPDDWETDEVIMHRVAKILGLCEEDAAAMLASTDMQLTVREEEGGETPLTAQLIEQEFAEYENELHRSTGTRRDQETWGLARAANRLSNEGYRIIDHAAWHQDALERGASKPILVQFGESGLEDRFEVEGTVLLSSARFLHLDVDLWKSVEPRDIPTGTDQLPRLLYYSMQESRRLTLGTTHYFDHPKFGLLVRIQRLPVPRRLEVLLEQLDNAF